MRIFKNRWFIRFARREKISDDMLCEAVMRMEHGLVDADLGGGVFKQRIARTGGGKSGGYRAIVLLRSGERAFFVYGFAKSQQATIRKHEEKEFKKLANHVFLLTDTQLNALIEAGHLEEVQHNGKKI